MIAPVPRITIESVSDGVPASPYRAPAPPTTAFLVATLCALSCGIAWAAPAPGLYLSWNDCPGGASASPSATFSCDTESGEQDLIPAFVLSSPIDSVIAVEIVVDIQFAGFSVPSWWHLEPAGCRFGRLAPSTLPPPANACANFWNQDLSAGFLYLIGQPRGGANQARMVVSFALPDVKAARRLEADSLYLAARLALLHSNPTNCVGCSTSACLVLNSILIGRVPGAAGGDVLLTTPGPADANRATWQGSSANCSTVPVRPSTWGRLKGLYR
jgi:hypothetical protein